MINNKISIITICFENPKELERTLRSIKSQIYSSFNYELIIIDGSISSECQKVANKYQDIVTILYNHTAKGIYNAMNKGLDFVTGETVLYMNSGDIISKAFSFMKFNQKLNHKVKNNIIFCDFKHRLDDLSFHISMKKIVKEKSWWNRRLPSHQAVFMPANYLKQNKFNEDLKISADTLFLRTAFSQINSIYYNDVLCEFYLGGVSNYPKNLNDVTMHHKEIKKTRNLSVKESLLTYFSLLRRMILIRIFGFKLYYRIVWSIKEYFS